jgi:peptidoglycan hydrolase-like protein with peptidoglycan-binding domain
VIAFRQLIRQGQSGSDVVAVKRALQKMNVPGSGSLNLKLRRRKYAGASFTRCIRTVQRNHKVHQDGIYGKRTHELIAPHFDAYGRLLYRRAKMRKPQRPPVPTTAVGAAKRLLELAKTGKYHDDRGTTIKQLQATAAGRAVYSPLGHYVKIDERVLELLVWLIDQKGFKVGTFALCTDHGPDSPKGHAGGFAVDVSSIDGISILSSSSKPKVIALLNAMRAAPGALRPRQLISGGVANRRDGDCSALSLPAADAYYGPATMLQHCNHIHIGF